MPVAKGRWKRIKQSITPVEAKEISRTARNLRTWAAVGCPGKVQTGRPRLYFGLREEPFRLLMQSCHANAPDLTQGLNWGLALDESKQEAWRACVKVAYAPGYFWVGVEDSHTHVYDTFPCPISADDVPAVVALFRPKVTFHWAASLQPLTYSMPWPIPRARSPYALRTFFGLDKFDQRLYVSASAAPSQRCGTNSLALIGISGLDKDLVRAKLSLDRLGPPGWFKANERTLLRVAKLCSTHARKVLLP